MEISVVIPAYNVENVLADAVNSVMEQTFLSYIKEIIIVDDGSRDKTAKLMKQLKMKNVNTSVEFVLVDQSNGGASKARNAGIAIARGDWIALLDADDEWEKNKIEEQVYTIQKHPEIDFLGCGHDHLELKILFKKIDKLYKASVKDICIKNFPVTPSIVFRKSIIKNIGYFNEERKYMEDNEFCLRVCEKYGFYYLPISLVNTGHGKKPVGESGLSANVKCMYEGRVANMKELHARGSIGDLFYMFITVFNFLKYVRRMLLK